MLIKKKLRTALAASLCSFALLGGLQVLPASAVTSGTYESDTIKYTNYERTKRGLVALKSSTCLDTYAERQARAMASQARLFHQSMSPILSACGLEAVGENVAVGYGSGKSVTAAFMASSGHRENLLRSRFRTMAVGAYLDSKGRWWVSEVFGDPR